MFVSLGAAPVSYLTGVSTQSTAMDSMRAALGKTNPTTSQIQRRSQWKLSDQGDPRSPCLQMRAQELAKFLFIIYLEMFSVEGLSAYQDLNISKISGLVVIHYTRSSFAEFVLFLSSSPGILARQSVSTIVCINLIVPRESLDALISLDNATLGTPALRAEITGTTGNGWQNFFSTVQMSFGSVITRNTTSIVVREDPQG
jgi:hypothetical protein